MRQLTCPNDGCRKVLKLPPELSGKKVRCPKCGTAFVLDAAAPATAAPAPPPAPAPVPPPAPVKPAWADFDDGLPYLPDTAPARTYVPPPAPAPTPPRPAPTPAPAPAAAAMVATASAAAVPSRPPQPSAALPPPPPPSEPDEPDEDERTNYEPNERRDPGRGERRDRIVSAVAAVLVQVVLFLLMGLTGTSDSGAAPPEESVAFAQLDDEQLTNTDDGQLDDSSGSSGGDVSTDTLTTPSVEISVSTPTTDGDALDLSVSLTASGGGGASGEGGDGFGFGSHGQGRGGEASFLGTTARGNRFCIIADNSGSMNGPPLEYVKQEILKTLDQSRGGAKFYIVFFNSVGEPQPLNRWASGKADANDLAQWIRGMRSRGGTEPITGFEIAFKLDPAPDVIYFMTDGGFAHQQVQQIDRGNKGMKKPAVIHTICFLNNGGEPQLKQIAADAKGTYRFVPGFKRP